MEGRLVEGGEEVCLSSCLRLRALDCLLMRRQRSSVPRFWRGCAQTVGRVGGSRGALVVALGRLEGEGEVGRASAVLWEEEVELEAEYPLVQR